MVIPQFFYRKFGANFFPAWPGLPWAPFWSCLFTVIAIAACIAITFDIKGRTVSLILGGLLLAMYVVGALPYELFIDPNHNHLYAWADLLKELALAGGAFVIAGSFPEKPNIPKSYFIKLLERLIPLGSIFFCITMVSFGCCHFLYTEPISKLVPAWIPGAIFWTYFAGVMLVGSGIAIVSRIRLRISAMLLAIMIFLWLIVLHIPLAIADPYGRDAGQPIGAFSALAFCATAFVIAYNASRITTRPALEESPM
jgi:uncharacterized membrane protein YphA (DoxX/SURF4 family)